jgi:hypothetical protein
MATNIVGTLSNAGDSVSIQTDFVGSITAYIASYASAQNVIFESTIDGVTWEAVNVYPVATTLGYSVPVPTTTAPGDYRFFIDDGADFRVRLLSISSGGQLQVTLIPSIGAAIGTVITNPVTSTLQSLTDVEVVEGPAIDGKFLMWNNATAKWVAQTVSGSGSGVSALASLDDVAVTEGSAIDGQVLAWSNVMGKWIAKPLPTASTYSIMSLTDVAVTDGAAINGLPLVYNNSTSKWVAQALTLAGLSDVSVAEGPAINGSFLAYSSVLGKWVPATITTLPNTPLSSLADVQVSEGASIDGQYLAWSNSAGKWVSKAGSSTLAGLADVSVTEGAGINGLALVWNNAQSKWTAQAVSTGSTTLQGLTDVGLTEGPAIDGQVLVYSNSVGKWVAQAIAPGTSFTTLSDVQISEGPAIAGQYVTWSSTASKWVTQVLPAQSLAGLTDVQVTEGASLAGQFLMWNNAAGKWVGSGIPSSTLASLSDVSIQETDAIDGYYLVYNNAATQWQAKPLQAIPLSSLSDVQINEGTGIDGKFLTYSNEFGKWLAGTPPIPFLAALGDVNVNESEASDGQYLVWNNTDGKWISQPFPEISLSQLADVEVQEGEGIDSHFLVWDNALSKWIAVTGPSPTLGGLNDVEVTDNASITDYVLRYSNSLGKWVPTAITLNSQSAVKLDSTIQNTGLTLTNSNKTATGTQTGWQTTRATLPQTIGKLYAELTVNAIGDGFGFGIVNGNAGLGIGNATMVGVDTNGIMMFNNVTAETSGVYYNNAIAGSIGTGLPTTGSTVSVAVDFIDKLIWFWNPSAGQWNGDVIANQNPAAGVGGYDLTAITSDGNVYLAVALLDSNSQVTINGGSDTLGFVNPIPAGFNPWTLAVPNLISDASVNDPIDGQVLTYSAAQGKWINEAPAVPAPTPQPYDMFMFYPGIPTGGADMARLIMPRDVSLPLNLTGSYAGADVAATAAVAMILAVNGIEVGTVNFATDSAVGTFTFATAVTLNPGDILTLTNQSTTDATLSNVSITLVGTR